MEILWLILAGIAGGIFGGMGMGGGTLLIPILTIFLNVPQHSAQSVNLIAFIPMAVIALIIHFKKKLVCTKHCLYIIIPAVAISVLGAFLSKNTAPKVLSRLFGGFLIVLGIWMLITEIVGIVKSKKEKQEKPQNADSP